MPCKYCNSKRHSTDRCLMGMLPKKGEPLQEWEGNKDYAMGWWQGIDAYKEKMNLIRIPLGSMTIDQARILKLSVKYERQRYPERHKKHQRVHLVLRNKKDKPRLCKAWLILNP